MIRDLERRTSLEIFLFNESEIFCHTPQMPFWENEWEFHGSSKASQRKANWVVMRRKILTFDIHSATLFDVFFVLVLCLSLSDSQSNRGESWSCVLFLSCLDSWFQHPLATCSHPVQSEAVLQGCHWNRAGKQGPRKWKQLWNKRVRKWWRG